MRPELSIIIPARNEAQHLPALLASLHEQEMAAIEVIVADGCSQDATAHIAHAAGCSVVKGGLPAQGRNRGARVARADTLLFLDADVILPPGFLPVVLKEFRQRNLEIGACFLEPVSANRRVLYRIINLALALMPFVIPPASGDCILVRKALHWRVGGFNEALAVGEDLDYVKRAAKLGRFGILRTARPLASTRRYDRRTLAGNLLRLAWVEVTFLLFGRVRGDPFSHLAGWR